MLKPENQEPLYIQLKKAIQAMIFNGDFQQGDKIPTEVELSEQYNISRITVRKAVEEMVKEGYLIKKQGKGTFVNNLKIDRKVEHVMSFSAACESKGLTSHSVITKKEIIEPDEDLKKDLRLEEDEKVIYIQRKRYAGNSPLMLENNYYPQHRFQFLMNESLEGSLYDLLEKKYDIRPENPGETILEITLADEEKAQLLETSLGKALFYMRTIIYDQHNQPVHVGRQYIIGERYQFTL
ncbi:GntR family transcriptional regulator [Domibacillus sp. DTU_2020_1001157_1_SI_ALB_TIR_016]|uniref:GntR family transcriptional regulator n=1 Tax=Domibacillus sp. DTU_2020_1001157_1_SI_ALB_TIR_016 TaxID=3077789 RepID=UPI0028E56CAB|nr:GntR family transcriptional regulator [Domibacillus sp. DTU_2020_1001157_1_SI_ALB_TIR_016]WNS79238.1 GntR family transcriptional regulator [Domibacillus sp. DTU_2020_1001157_1_SI_ALB_TIR_016]